MSLFTCFRFLFSNSINSDAWHYISLISCWNKPAIQTRLNMSLKCIQVMKYQNIIKVKSKESDTDLTFKKLFFLCHTLNVGIPKLGVVSESIVKSYALLWSCQNTIRHLSESTNLTLSDCYNNMRFYKTQHFLMNLQSIWNWYDMKEYMSFWGVNLDCLALVSQL